MSLPDLFSHYRRCKAECRFSASCPGVSVLAVELIRGLRATEFNGRLIPPPRFIKPGFGDKMLLA